MDRFSRRVCMTATRYLVDLIIILIVNSFVVYINSAGVLPPGRYSLLMNDSLSYVSAFHYNGMATICCRLSRPTDSRVAVVASW